MADLTELALHENQLTGPIPVSLGALTSLQLLWLANNALTGPIPASLGNLIELQELKLYGNDVDRADPGPEQTHRPVVPEASPRTS